MRSEKEFQNLQKANISGGTWIDAGCGQGAYTIPLSGLVDSVLAIDQNNSNLRILQNKINRFHVTNVTIKQGNFKDLKLYEEGYFNRILFTFSLHYSKDLGFLQEILKLKKKQDNFKIVIIEYTRTIPVPWVPYPCPLPKIVQLISELDDYESNIKYQNNRYYIVEIKKKHVL